MCVDGSGLATVADSFAALAQRIEQEGLLGWDEVVKVLRQDYSVVIGSRLKGQREKGAIRPLNLAGNYLLTLIANRSEIKSIATFYFAYSD